MRLIEFKNKEKRPVRITEEQYQKIRGALNKDKFIEINGIPYSTSSIDCIPKVKEEPLMLKAPEGKPISKKKLDELNAQIKKVIAKWTI